MVWGRGWRVRGWDLALRIDWDSCYGERFHAWICRKLVVISHRGVNYLYDAAS